MYNMTCMMCVIVLQWKCSLPISKWIKWKLGQHFLRFFTFFWYDTSKKRKNVFSNYVDNWTLQFNVGLIQRPKTAPYVQVKEGHLLFYCLDKSTNDINEVVSKRQMTENTAFTRNKAQAYTDWNILHWLLANVYLVHKHSSLSLCLLGNVTRKRFTV